MTGRDTAPSLALSLVGLMILVVSWNGVHVGSNAIVDFVMVPATALVLIHLLTVRRSPPIPAWLLAPGLGIGVAALITAIFPPARSLVSDPLIAQIQAAGISLGSRSDATSAAKFEVGIVVVPLLIAAVATNPALVRRFADLWAMSCLVSAMIAVGDLTHITHLGPVLPGAEGRQSGLTTQPNHLGLTCAMALPLVILWFTRGGRWRLAAFGGAAVLLLAVYASGSRAATGAAAVAVLGTVAFQPKLKRLLPSVLPVTGMLALAVLFFSSAPAGVAQHVRLSGSAANVAASDQQRSFAATIALSDIQARPIEGVGFAVIDDAHNIYLQLLAAGGIITFAAFLIYVSGIARLVFRLAPSEEGELARALGLVLLVWLLNGFIGNQVADRYLFVPVGLLLALSTCAGWRAAPTPTPPSLGVASSGEPNARDRPRSPSAAPLSA